MIQSDMAFFTGESIFYTIKSQIVGLKVIAQSFLISWEKYLSQMQVNLNELANSYEVVPVSLSDPFKSLVTEPSTMEVLRFIPIIAFIALIITAVWRQGMKFPVKAIGDLNKDSKQE